MTKTKTLRDFQKRAKGMGWSRGWSGKLFRAQSQTKYGKYKRIPYANEFRKDEPEHLCHDCGCALGELHVPGCDMEECPKCSGQSISCFCTL